jgi:hypothetical protein
MSHMSNSRLLVPLFDSSMPFILHALVRSLSDIFCVNRSVLSLTLMTPALVSPALKSRSVHHSFCRRMMLFITANRFVESRYKLEIGAAQNTQLAKAISTGAEKGTFVLPKGA